MYAIIGTLIAVLGIIVLAAMYYHSKNNTVKLICEHPELSNEKVNSISAMMSTQHKNTIQK